MEDVTIPASSPAPRPGPAERDLPSRDARVGKLRSAFDDLLADSAGTDTTATDGAPEGGHGTVDDHQVEALDAAHELLARALTALDSTR